MPADACGSLCALFCPDVNCVTLCAFACSSGASAVRFLCMCACGSAIACVCACVSGCMRICAHLRVALCAHTQSARGYVCARGGRREEPGLSYFKLFLLSDCLASQRSVRLLFMWDYILFFPHAFFSRLGWMMAYDFSDWCYSSTLALTRQADSTYFGMGKRHWFQVRADAGSKRSGKVPSPSPTIDELQRVL